MVPIPASTQDQEAGDQSSSVWPFGSHDNAPEFTHGVVVGLFVQPRVLLKYSRSAPGVVTEGTDIVTNCELREKPSGSRVAACTCRVTPTGSEPVTGHTTWGSVEESLIEGEGKVVLRRECQMKVMFEMSRSVLGEASEALPYALATMVYINVYLTCSSITSVLSALPVRSLCETASPTSPE